MTRFDASAVLGGLKDFQRTTVDHVMQRFFDPANPARRFLVADETGLGKSVVARGIVARMIERLQDDPTVDRIDIVYVCSNYDIAHQNLARLDVTGGQGTVSTTRLTLLARDAHHFSGDATVAEKPVTLVAFTPGTSFDRGRRTGQVDERALIFLMLVTLLDLDDAEQQRAVTLLRATAGRAGMCEAIERVRSATRGAPDASIVEKFHHESHARGQLARFQDLLRQVGDQGSLPDELWERTSSLIGGLRHSLATASVERLEPDLVIFDEFQRFRQLMDPEHGGETAELARALYDHGDAKLLLLSATPYKPFTMVEESAAGDDHYADFRQTLRFLAQDEAWDERLNIALTDHRRSMLDEDGLERRAAAHRVRDLLLRVMTRTERPRLGQDGMLSEQSSVVTGVERDDLLGYVALRRVAEQIKGHMSMDYWKSAPYFLNFAEDYQVGLRLKERLRDPNAADVDLSHAQLLDSSMIADFGALDGGNARFRALVDQTLNPGWWRLLWMPPSMPYYRLAEPFAAAAAAGVTKRLVFSAWNATPAAVASLLSYEAERRLVEQSELPNDQVTIRRATRRLAVRFDDGRPSSLSAVALFWPQPELAERCDPLRLAREDPAEPMTVNTVRHRASELVMAMPLADAESDLAAAETVLRWPAGELPESVSVEGSDADDDQEEHETDAQGWPRALQWALNLERQVPARVDVERNLDRITSLGVFAPGNTAWRAVGRLLDADSEVTRSDRWRAALRIATGLRTLFQRPDTVLLLEQLYPDIRYWQAVLDYCASGALQSVLDEFLHHLRSEKPDGPLTQQTLIDIAASVGEILSLRTVTLRAFDPHHPDDHIALRCRFALRYGGRQNYNTDDVRATEVRAAFNSPFWPFVLATTSAGQEGIDFHWWCSAVVHWNTPSNPVDFEQREGRVHRFGGHAIRRNVAAAHRPAVMSSSDPDPWRAAYEAARAESVDLGEFCPYWVYPGQAKIERHVLTYPLSRDQARYEQLKVDLATYRLAFGQPRQEDMLELLRRRGSSIQAEPIDLRPRGPI